MVLVENALVEQMYVTDTTTSSDYACELLTTIFTKYEDIENKDEQSKYVSVLPAALPASDNVEVVRANGNYHI